MARFETIIGYVFLLGSMCFSASVHAQSLTALPNARQIAWQQAELGIIFHYDLHVFDGKRYRQGENRVTPIANYQIFQPGKLDVEQWVLAAKAAGARFALITATHETGFALFQSDYNPYSMKALNWKDGKADLVRDFVDACRKHGIKPGIYLGIRWNSFLGVHDFKVDGSGIMQEKRQQYYNHMVEGMLKELCTNYGPLFEIWFDGGASSPELGAPDVLPIVQKYQPQALFYHYDQLAEARWGGSETGTVGYPCWSSFPFPYTSSGENAPQEIRAGNFHLLKHGDPDGAYWVPAMADAPLRGYAGRHEWFWEPGDEAHIYPLSELMDMYYKSVGRNATLILGVTPDDTGLVPEADVQRLREFGNAIKRRFDHPIKTLSGKGNRLEIRLPEMQQIDQIVLKEALETGHRVRKFRIQVQNNRGWNTIFTGSAIGHKLIHLLEKPVNARALRLIVDSSTGQPVIEEFSVYNTKDTL